MSRKQSPTAWLIVTSQDSEQFNVRGPVKDDSDVVERVVALQRRGRNINCQTVPVQAGETLEEIARRFEAEMDQRLKFTERPLDIE